MKFRDWVCKKKKKSLRNIVRDIKSVPETHAGRRNTATRWPGPRVHGRAPCPHWFGATFLRRVAFSRQGDTRGYSRLHFLDALLFSQPHALPARSFRASKIAAQHTETEVRVPRAFAGRASQELLGDLGGNANVERKSEERRLVQSEVKGDSAAVTA
jgi:hypothetical protein